MKKTERMNLDLMIVKELQSASKSAEITEKIAIEFVNWLWREIPEQAMAQESWKHWWNEWLKTKQ